MKYLTFALLLLVLVSSQASPIPKIISTILFDDGLVSAEGFDLDKLAYTYFRGGLRFRVKPNSRYIWGIPEEIIEVNDLGVNSSFALDIFKRVTSDKGSDTEFCFTHSNATLTHLISYCDGKIAMRVLTAEEKQKMQQLKDGHSGLSEPEKPFKLVYNKDSVKIASIVKLLSLNYKLYRRDPYTGLNELSIDIDNWAFKRHSFMEIHADDTNLIDGSFVIEGVSGPDCEDSDLPDLKIWKCFGDIRLRRFDEHLDS